MAGIGFAQNLKPSPEAVNPPFKIEISPDGNVNKLTAPLMINVVLTNISNRPLVFLETTPSEANYMVTVLDSRGVAVPDTGWAQSLKNPPPLSSFDARFNSIEPGKSRDDELDITDLVKINQPGTYTIQMEKVVPVFHTYTIPTEKIVPAVHVPGNNVDDPNEGKVVKSNIITVTVTP
jgi:hypothetical protein